MKLHLLTSTPNVETLIATAMLTTTSGAAPSNLYYKLCVNPNKVAEIVGRLEVQHGNILEHNRLNWLLDAGEGEVLKVLLANRFFTFTRLASSRWLVSASLRAVVEYQAEGGEFADLLLASVKDKFPHIHAFGRQKL